MRSSLTIVFAFALAACGHERSSQPESTPTSQAVFPVEPPAPKPFVAIEPIGEAREGSEVVLARIAGTRVALVADGDERAIHTIDLERKREIARTQVDGRPGRMLVLPGDRLAVTLRDAARVVVLGADGAGRPLRATASVDTADEPIALALPKAKDLLYVATGYGRTLEGYALDDLRSRVSRRLGREPRAVTIDDAGRPVVAYMTESHASVLGESDVAAALPTDPSVKSAARQAFAVVRVGGKVVVPFVRVTTGEPNVITGGYGQQVVVAGAPVPSTAFAIASFDPSAPTPVAATQPKIDCALPRDAVAALDGVAVACMGSDEVAFAGANGVVVKTVHVAGGPHAIAWDPEKNEAIVATELDRTLVTIGAEGGASIGPAHADSIALSHVAGFGLSASALAGKRLFHRATDRRISSDGRTCASCHPDGREDGMVWPTPNGPRQTLFLAGRLRRDEGFGWEAKHGSIPEHVKSTVQNLHGTGLGPTELAQIAAYCIAMPPPPRKERALTPEEAHGRDLFLSDQTGCSSCHVDTTLFTDSSPHDVKSAASSDKSVMFLAPPLRFVGGSAPFFHDGRFASIGALLRGTRTTMGKTDELTDRDLDALEAYLRTL